MSRYGGDVQPTYTTCPYCQGKALANYKGKAMAKCISPTCHREFFTSGGINVRKV